MIHFILALWASYVALSYFEKEDYQRIAKTICLSAGLLSAVCILQSFGLDIFGKIARYNFEHKFSAFLDNPNIAGNYLALSLPFFLLIKEKKYYFGLFLVSAGVILSQSLFSVICGVIGITICLLLMLRANKKVFFSLLFFCFIISILVICNFNLFKPFFSGRLELWKMAWVNFKDNPIFGQGIGIFKTWEITPVDTKWLVVHNDWFERTIELGVVGLVLMLFVVVNSLKKFNYKIDNKLGFVYLSSFISFLVLMLGSFPMEVAPLALFGLTTFWAVETL